MVSVGANWPGAGDEHMDAIAIARLLWRIAEIAAEPATKENSPG